eukprot:CAMPEP_0115755846 /NCGR_PEP_ID=MMETSP0272-20121206/97602_1 /TAXON_ID=71861 /ORGANISM="Scrippsiella trochoidea, Strain CCMP3099" /LENGTH=100 /DNA_ID=CAMNT_0003201309 /DNA_START=313 /DNA_END=613 /DNA_ORIENTATION=+
MEDEPKTMELPTRDACMMQRFETIATDARARVAAEIATARMACTLLHTARSNSSTPLTSFLLQAPMICNALVRGDFAHAPVVFSWGLALTQSPSLQHFLS